MSLCLFRESTAGRKMEFGFGSLFTPAIFKHVHVHKYDQMIQMGWLHQNSLVLVQGEDRPKCPQQNLIVFF